LIYYPLSLLILAGIRDVLVITRPQDRSGFEQLLGNGSDLGVSIAYACQPQPPGAADALLVSAAFIGDDAVTLMAGDIVLCGEGLNPLLAWAGDETHGATVFAIPVRDPRQCAVLVQNEQAQTVDIIEKPRFPRSNLAVPGVYFYDNSVLDLAASLAALDRGPTSITDLNRLYLRRGRLRIEELAEGFAWFDVDTPTSLLVAADFVASLQKHQHLRVGDVTEVARRRGFLETRTDERSSDSSARSAGSGPVDEIRSHDKDDEEVPYVWPNRIISDVRFKES
jgi:glucose-1-phosphate thymidylyltransferase